MSRRKKYDRQRGILLSVRALLKSNKVAVVNVELPHCEKQGLIHWQNLKSIGKSRAIAHAICDYPHHWTIYLAVFCRSQSGENYIKSVEIAPQGQYKTDQLGEVMEQCHDDLMATCNPGHVIGSGWIARPISDSLTEEQADAIFTACGVWKEPEQEKAA